MAKRKVKVKKIGKILLLVVMVICAGVIYLFANKIKEDYNYYCFYNIY